MNSIKIENLTAKTGEKVQALVKVYDTETVMPITIINGRLEGKNILITAGVHGGEYPGIVATMRAAGEINPEDVKGSITIIHPVNTQSFEKRTSEVIPEDGKNLNAIFPGKKDGTLGDKIAHFIGSIQEGKDFHLDLHSGDLHEHAMPFTYFPGSCDENITEIAREAASSMDLQYMVKSGSTKGAYSSGAINGVPGLLMERSGRGLWTEEEAADYKKDIYSLLNHFDVVKTEQAKDKKVPTEITEATYLVSSNSGCWFPKVVAGEHFKEGQYLGYITDYFGNKLEEHYAKYNGVVLYMTRSLSVPDNCPLVAYGKI